MGSPGTTDLPATEPRSDAARRTAIRGGGRRGADRGAVDARAALHLAQLPGFRDLSADGPPLARTLPPEAQRVLEHADEATLRRLIFDAVVRLAEREGDRSEAD
jgi:hypothetical protein